jgi:uncharacterized membrane protein SpoIIM required for sporulation
MRERLFVARRQEGWERLEALLKAVDRGGLRRMGADEIQELALRYRSATTDLAAAQSRAYSEPTRAYLNRLTARAHAYVYAESASNGWARLVEFFGSTFPVEVRRSAAVIGGCTAVFVIAAVIAYGLVAERPLNVYALLPASMVPIVDKSLHDSNFAFDRAYAPEMASAIITNNVKVAMLAFAGGMTLGVVTFLSILQNGLMVGALGALFGAKGFGLDFWATIAPHGVIELTSIQISAGAGLLLAQAIVAPGRMRRIDALKANARRAGVLMIGVAGLLCVAGTIEGFISPQRTSIAFRIAFGALTALLLTAYLGLAGRKRAVALALCLAVAALRPAAARADELTIHVDTPTVFASLLNKIALAYRAVNPSVTVLIRERTFGDALHDLDTAAADIAILDRGPGGPTYVDRPVAIVPYAFVADPRAGVSSLTTAQITAIWSGRITNWSQAGGAALPAVLIGRPANSGATALFVSLFGAATPSAMLVDNNSAAVVAAVRDNRGAIGYVGLAYANLDGVRTLAIDGSQPDAEGIASGKYRFYTTIHAVGSAPPSPVVSRFLSFAESRREMLHDAGFLTIFETKPH